MFPFKTTISDLVAGAIVLTARTKTANRVLNAMTAGVDMAIKPITVARRIGEAAANLESAELVVLPVGLLIVAVVAPYTAATTLYEKFVK